LVSEIREGRVELFTLCKRVNPPPYGVKEKEVRKGFFLCRRVKK
jgi:hypothetical protein